MFSLKKIKILFDVVFAIKLNCVANLRDKLKHINYSLLIVILIVKATHVKMTQDPG